MAVQMTAAGANAALDGGLRAALAGGKLVLKIGAGVAVTYNLATPAFAAPAGGSMTMAGLPLSANATAAGDLNGAELRQSNDTVLATMTVGTAGADVTVNNINVAVDQTVNITAFTFSFPTA